MEEAVGLAKVFGAKLTALSVVDYSAVAWIHDSGVMVVPEILDGMRDSFKACLERCSVLAKEAGVAFEQVLLTGSPAHSIVEYADKNDIDLIVLGHIGRTAAATLLLGSVAYKVTNQAKCSVFVVK
jgi:nucleotide-binding universal stress UspA family protein